MGTESVKTIANSISIVVQTLQSENVVYKSQTDCIVCLIAGCMSLVVLANSAVVGTCRLRGVLVSMIHSIASSLRVSHE